MNSQAIHPVLLIIADISGYTRFMVSSDIEIEHSQQIISELIQAIIRQVEIPLEVAKLEGDAIFLYVKKDAGPLAWDDVRRVTADKLIRFFDVFHEKLREISAHTDCPCGACSNLRILKLKIIAHSGEALFYRIHHFDELSGRDVILAHRLLKNSVRPDEYLLMTEPAYEDLGCPNELRVEQGHEHYEHLGRIKTYVHSPASHAMRQLRFAGNATRI